MSERVADLLPKAEINAFERVAWWFVNIISSFVFVVYLPPAFFFLSSPIASSHLVQAPLCNLSCVRKMQKRKRNATITKATKANATATASDVEDGPPRGALQPRPNPPAKRPRTGPSKQSDKEKLSGKSRKAQTVIKAKALASQVAAAASSLPPEIWRLIGQEVNTSILCMLLSEQHKLIASKSIASSSENLTVTRSSLSRLPQYIHSSTPRMPYNKY
jgi:hypothetical protein